MNDSTHRSSICALLAVAAALGAACDPIDDSAHEHELQHGHDAWSVGHLSLFGQTAVLAAVDDSGAVTVRSDEPALQLGLMATGEIFNIEATALDSDGIWSTPFEVEITWREGELIVARAALPFATRAVRLRGLAGASEVQAELFPELRIRAATPLARDLPFETSDHGERRDDGTTVRRQAAQPDWVVTRADWGARSTSTMCGDAHTPQRMTIHHTAGPTVDTISSPARVRQIQAYHIDSNEWCDIGYHFLVGQDGRVYQGRHSELRTGAHAYMANTDNVGIALLGTYTTAVPSDVMFNATSQIMAWLAESYTIPLNRSHVFGHREQGATDTMCPGDALFARLQRLIDGASGSETEPEPTDHYAASMTARLVGLEDRLEDGRSGGVLDAVPGERFSVDVRLTNASSVPIRGVTIGYAFDEPFVEATGYHIESDHPGYDQVTWTTNSADTDPGNPPRDGLGASGHLVMHAFSPRETKRVVFDLVAGSDSLGRGPSPSLRFWVREVDDVYGPQGSFDGTPPLNRFGSTVRASAAIDVLGDSAWFFDGDGAGGLEGWSECGVGGLAGLRAVSSSGVLEANVADVGACLLSPEWTHIDAGRFDELVLSLRSFDGPAWIGLGFDTERGGAPTADTVFRIHGDRVFRTYVVPVDDSPLADFDISALAVHLDLAGEVGGLFDVGELWLQSSETRETSSDRVAYFDGSRASVFDPSVVDDTDPAEPSPTTPTTPVDPDAGLPADDAGSAADAGTDAGIGFDVTPVPDDVDVRDDAGDRPPGPGDEPGRGGSRSDVSERSPPSNGSSKRDRGCASSGGATPVGWASLLFVGLAMSARRRPSARPRA